MWRSIQVTVLLSAIVLSMPGSQTVAAETQGFQTVNMQIDGMTCGACVRDVKTALVKVPGVSAVEVMVGKKWVFFSDYADTRASVTFDPTKTGVESLVKAVEAASSPLSAYKARLVQP